MDRWMPEHGCAISSPFEPDSGTLTWLMVVLVSFSNFGTAVTGSVLVRVS